ncbi:MAG TPA: prepilin-type N-terminal cleavage/methylation domain-containing protein [Candidatus Acidoferrum sp.]|jgi:prepilin-type N-terminal cleavage/methylation domain-containing protein
MNKRHKNRMKQSSSERGFTLLEMLLATVIILVGLVAVAQLVPTSVMLNSNNRSDATALVFAQHVLEGMRNQPLSATTYTDPQGVLCPLGNTCNLGDPTQPSVLVGNAVNTTGGSPIIDFSTAPVAGYSFVYVDPNDPLGATYDVRWAMVTRTNASGIVTSKRIILGAFRRGMRSPTLPVTLDTMVSK